MTDTYQFSSHSVSVDRITALTRYIWQPSGEVCQNENAGERITWNRWNSLNSALISNWRDKTYGMYAPIGLHNVDLLSNKKREFSAVTISYNEQREGGVTNRRNWQRSSGWRVRVQWWVAGFHNTVCARLNVIAMFIISELNFIVDELNYFVPGCISHSVTVWTN